MTQPPVDSTPILIIAFAAILFVVVLLFIAYILNAGDKTEEFEPYDEGYEPLEGRETTINITEGSDIIYCQEGKFSSPEIDKKLREDDIKSKVSETLPSASIKDNELDFFDYHIIEFMKDSASPRYSNHPVWVKAFALYNKNHRPVSALCSPCYIKVLQYIIKLKNGKTNQEKNGNPGC